MNSNIWQFFADFNILWFTFCSLFFGRFLNVNTPLQLGGVDTSSDFKYPPELSFVGGFVGCLRNVDQDGKIYNLEKTGRSKNTEPGCKITDGNCNGANGLPICKNGTCVANLREAYCICDPGFVGEFCEMGKYNLSNKDGG